MDIALSAGFPDSQNFSRHFKQHYGCPPAEYRRTYARQMWIRDRMGISCKDIVSMKQNRKGTPSF